MTPKDLAERVRMNFEGWKPEPASAQYVEKSVAFLVREITAGGGLGVVPELGAMLSYFPQEVARHPVRKCMHDIIEFVRGGEASPEMAHSLLTNSAWVLLLVEQKPDLQASLLEVLRLPYKMHPRHVDDYFNCFIIEPQTAPGNIEEALQLGRFPSEALLRHYRKQPDPEKQHVASMCDSLTLAAKLAARRPRRKGGELAMGGL